MINQSLVTKHLERLFLTNYATLSFKIDAWIVIFFSIFFLGMQCFFLGSNQLWVQNNFGCQIWKLHNLDENKLYAFYSLASEVHYHQFWLSFLSKVASCCKTPCSVEITIGQLISKCLFSFFNSSKKRTKNLCTSRLGQKSWYLSSFFERIEDIKKTFWN